jgi:peptide/nickel transport system substrate-binding protein
MKYRSSADIRTRALVGAALLFTAALAVALSGALAVAAASTRPRVGGTLRVEIGERVPSLDPRTRPASSQIARAQEMLDALVFDRLLRLDDQGRAQPSLAVAWQAENGGKRWRFQLRPGVQFSDGTPLTADIAAAALAPIVATMLGANARVTAAGAWLVIESEEAMPELPQRLAVGRAFIFRVAADGSLAGTGPFVLDEWISATRGQATFVANTHCWAGRPFVDRVVVSLGVEASRLEADLEFGLADAGELAPAEMRRAAERGVRTWSSEPMDLFVVELDPYRPAVQDERLRAAIAAAIDRNAIANVVLQRQAVPAGALLPQWISGYAFLFPVSAQSAAQSGVPAAPAAVKPAAPLVLVYDSQDAEARAVAERVIVDLRAAGISAQADAGAIAANAPPADLRIERIPIEQPDAQAAFALVLGAFRSPVAAIAPALAAAPSADAENPESLYGDERAALEGFHLVPLVHETENWGLGATLHDWMATRWDDLHLEDAWLDVAPPANASGASAAPRITDGTQ